MRLPLSRHDIGEVRDASGQTIASFWWNSSTTSPVTKDEARAFADLCVSYLNEHFAASPETPGERP